MNSMRTIDWKRWMAICLAAGLGASTLHAQLTYSNGLRLWLEADAGVTTNASGFVSSWADQTTNGFNVSQSTDSLKPLFVANVYNQMPALRFDGVNDLLNNTVANVLTSSQARTVFFVAEQDPTDTGGTLFTFRRATTGNRIMALSKFELNASTYIIYSDGVSVNETTPSQVAIVDDPFISTYAWDGQSFVTRMQEWLNGTAQVVSGPAARSETGLTGFTVGSREDITTAGWKGDIAEILVFDHVLAASDRQGVYEYLLAKYALPEPSAMMLLGLGGSLLWRKRIR